jgi:hypothetical protein
MSQLRKEDDMKTIQLSIMASAAAATLIAATGTARAQSAAGGETARSLWDQSLAAPSNALELTLGTGYTQGFGQYQKGAADNLKDVAGPGLGIDLGVGYRLSPTWMLGATGAYQAYQAGNFEGDTSAGGATARIDATYHLATYSRLDPWLKGGLGYRYLCECGTPSTRTGLRLHGFELFNLSAGLDLRFAKQIALAPVVGASLTTFLWDRTDAIADPRLGVFAYGGLQARFDVGGSYERPMEFAGR